MENWGFAKNWNKLDDWPADEKGEKIKPAFLMHVGGAPVDMEVELNVLDAYNIPTILQYPNNGDFGRIIIGHAGGGVDIYVPETMLDDAKNILNGNICEVEE